MYRKMEAETATLQNSMVLPHLKSMENFWKLPVMESAWNKSANLYGKVKESNGFVNWTLTTAETTVQKAIEQATPLVAPIAKKLESPIKSVDEKLCNGLGIVEEKVPLVKEQPEQIYATAKTYVATALQPAKDSVCAMKDYSVSKAATLKELSFQKANEILSTHYGSMAVNGIESTAAVAEEYLNTYFPPTEEDMEEESNRAADSEDKVTSTALTVGRVSGKVVRRLSRAIYEQTRNLNKDNIQEYVSSLIAVMHLTQYVNMLQQRAAALNQTSAEESSGEPAAKTKK